jgi:hypothetical protein
MADITTSTTIIDNTHECVFAFQYQYVDGGNESAVANDGILAESGVYVSAFTGTGGIMTIMLN